MDFDDVFKTVGLLVCWGIAIILGLSVFVTIAQGIVAFASTGLGAFILAIVGWKIFKDHFSDKD